MGGRRVGITGNARPAMITTAVGHGIGFGSKNSVLVVAPGA